MLTHPPSPPVDDVLRSCWWHLAHRDLDRHDDDFGPAAITDRDRWLADAADRWRRRCEDDARQVLAARPGLGVEQLAETLRASTT
jgi:hypothetical protein